MREFVPVVAAALCPFCLGAFAVELRCAEFDDGGVGFWAVGRVNIHKCEGVRLNVNEIVFDDF